MPPSFSSLSRSASRVRSVSSLLLALGLLILIASSALAKQAADLAGTWDLFRDGTRMSCRVMLQPERSDKGDYFLGMPAACRHAMPAIEKIGRWSLPDDEHLSLDDPAGNHMLILEAVGDAYTARGPDGDYTLKPIGDIGRAAGTFKSTDPDTAPGFAVVQPVAVRQAAKEEPERLKPADIAGRYAVLREKRDTGCMITLDDTTRSKVAGERAQLAPGCRDQGIVIFDPAGWQIVKGALVLTARAGHKTHLDRREDGTWQKDPKDGKPLGLKRL